MIYHWIGFDAVSCGPFSFFGGNEKMESCSDVQNSGDFCPSWINGGFNFQVENVVSF